MSLSSVFRKTILLLITVAAYSSADAVAQTYEAYLDSADNYIRLERWHDAAEATRHALRLKPGSPLNSRLFSNLGICLMHEGDYKSAIEAFDLALVRMPADAPLLASRASANVLDGNREAALVDVDKALSIDSLNSDALRIRGQLMLMKRRFPEAERDFSLLCKVDSTEVWGPAGLAECRINDGNYVEAYTLLDRAIALSDSPELRISLVQAQIEANRLDLAEESIREALKLYPRVGEFYLFRAVIHKKFYQNTEAELDKKIAKEYGADSQIFEHYFPPVPK